MRPPLPRNEGPLTLTRGAADRALVVGLDCASPALVFDRWRAHLPHLGALMARGAHGPLRSCHPPITVPAWRIMASGLDAGQQGVYGFTSRVGPAPDDLALTHSGLFEAPAIWDRLGAVGLRTTLVGLPGTWPPFELVGKLVTGPMTPEGAPFTWPASLAARVEAVSGGAYAFDVPGFRDLDPEALIERVEAMTEARFDLISALADDDDWNLLWCVEIGLDRLQHALWHAVDPRHPRYTGPSPLADRLRAYYERLDARIGDLVARCDDGDTAFFVVSDHGARPMEGGVLINEWLRRQGHLRLKREPTSPERLALRDVDWTRTRAWAAGGYCARVFLNLTGREPEGIVTPEQAPALLAELAAGLEAIPGPKGDPMKTRAHLADDLYGVNRRGAAPDLTVYFDDLARRALETVGADSLHAEANDEGFDAANHDGEGLLIAAGAGVAATGRVEGAALMDVASMLERLLGVAEAAR